MATKDELKVLFSTGKKPTGDDFSQLIEGVVGPKGDTGDAGAKGSTGAQGIQGIQGVKGDTGAQGTTGAAGATWLSGAVAPTTEGKTGDFYLNTANYDIYTKATGSWVKNGNIKGATGTTGTTGAQGPKGDTGAAGFGTQAQYDDIIARLTALETV